MHTCTLITYPGLGHQLSPVIAFVPGSGMFLQRPSPMSEYVLADLYGTTPTATHIGVKISSLNTNTISPSRSPSKR
jgi:hypothetical protein